MFNLLNAVEGGWCTHDYVLKEKRFEIRFDCESWKMGSSNKLTKDTWVNNVNIVFGKRKLHKEWNLNNQGITLENLEQRININAKEFIREYYKDFL